MQIFFDTVDYRTPHLHSEWELIWVVREKLLVKSEGGDRTLEPGDWALFCPGQIHELSKVDEGCLLYTSTRFRPLWTTE